ncbi:MAG: tRNA (adenosine(37)-N6)-threonylcarbamoyltransferase complex transferase subunit TsaD, partial [Hyphomicrobiaceae bacterium]|nr:tRNA (adenosine(37)-N6)-threonylcarbamoyltransferase complex transferase subunit TsaD [Hyphomicrobiaceae bacterium]
MSAPRANPSTGTSRVLGLETSCDETAAAVVERRPDGTGTILSNLVRSQWEEHRAFGGVVPEIAARAHVECLDDIVAGALADAGLGLRDLDGIAVTAGPGLIGGLLVGVTTAQTLALVHKLPLIAVNHLEAHALTVGLTEGLKPPYVLLLVSGGHTQLLVVHDVGSYRRLGSTIDDALGEAFDKTAKLLGLGFPGGPAVERAAAHGREGRFALPRPMHGRPEPNFSFAGLKTAVRHQAQALAPLTEPDIADLCADFQRAIADSVADRVAKALALATDVLGTGSLPDGAASASGRHLVVAGGVAANQVLRARLAETAAAAGFTLHVPPPALCTDNAAMVAWAGAERLARGLADDLLAVTARARWPLDPDAAPVLGAGRLGAKA